MKKDIKIILLTASKRMGKDTFVTILNSLYPNKFIPYSFANQLKDDLDPLSIKMFGKTSKELDGKEKEIFRSILISYGCAWRELNPLHWVEIVDAQIDWDRQKFNFVPVCVDCRFSNEINFFKNKYPDQTIVVEIIREGGPEPTDEEKRNIPLLKPLIDHTITWPTVLPDKKIEELTPFVVDFYSRFLKDL